MNSESRTDSEVSVIKQYFAAISANILCFWYGCALGWISPFLPLLSGKDSPLDIPLTNSQISMVASLLCVGGLVGTFVFSYVSDKFGRKTALLLSILPVEICWLLKLMCTSAESLYAARILAGFGGAAAYLVVPNYCVEISSLSTRGILGSLAIFGINGGIVFMYIIGAYFKYQTVLGVMLAVAPLGLIFIGLSPETPVFYVKHGKYEKALESIAWLRRESSDSPSVHKTLETLKRENNLTEISNTSNNSLNGITSDNGFEELSPNKILSKENKFCAPKFSESMLTNAKESQWKFFFSSKPTQKAFAVCFSLLTVQCMSGLFAVITFANHIFQQANTNMSPNVNSIIVGFLQLIGSIIASSMIERLGRKTLLIASCAIVSLGMAIIGSYFYAIDMHLDVSNIGWIPVTALSFVVSMYAVGMGPIPFLLISEIISVQGRGVTSGILHTWFWTASFVLAQSFNPLMLALGTYSVFWIFAIFGGSGIIITLMFLPETKGKPFDEILAHFSERKATSISTKLYDNPEFDL